MAWINSSTFEDIPDRRWAQMLQRAFGGSIREHQRFVAAIRNGQISGREMPTPRSISAGMVARGTSNPEDESLLTVGIGETR